MIWSKLCWDASCAEKVELSKLLPKINGSYPVQLQWNENYAKEGKAFFLWLPPHSELNGWFDKRPSEILKSYVLEGILTNSSDDYCKFDFHLEQITPLTEIFDAVEDTYKSPFPRIGLLNKKSCIIWEESRNFLKAKVGNYLYLSSSRYETQLEAIFSLENGKLYLHYSAYLAPAPYETLITRYCLNEYEQNLFKDLFDKAEKIDETKAEHLLEYEVRGAEYW